MNSEIRLFVGNLPETTNETDLRFAFSSFGHITNVDIKAKPGDDNNKKNFAFITLSASDCGVETCIKHFSTCDFKGHRLYVTRARESFLEKLQRERANEQMAKEQMAKEQTAKEQTAKEETAKEQTAKEQTAKELKQAEQNLPKENPVINLSQHVNPLRKKVNVATTKKKLKEETVARESLQAFRMKINFPGDGVGNKRFETNKKKQDADKKRIESLRKKRQDFKEKQQIINTGLKAIDNKVQNKKIIFRSQDLSPKTKTVNNNNLNNRVNTNTTVDRSSNKKKNLFEDMDDSADEITFESLKKQFESIPGQKVLELQSRYKSDKRFTLDERFIDNESEDEKVKDQSLDEKESENVELGRSDEKDKQLDILQDVLGVTIKKPYSENVHNKKVKSKLGMFRFDPTQPEHAKFFATVEEKQETKKTKRKKNNEKEQNEALLETETELPKPIVSKEQFYKVSETLKEAIAQPTTFSLRSLFGNNKEDSKKDEIQQDTGYIPLEMPRDQKKKLKNPLDRGEKNPFVYDSSDSEDEGKKEGNKQDLEPEITEVKAVWKENFFFTISDHRFKDGLAFFNKTNENEGHKERRGLKSLMKKRIYNQERKNQMFQKKIGGRKKTMKKSYRKKM